ncbi:MAG: DUF5667 domain-containing protein [Actinomycetota bacterium]
MSEPEELDRQISALLAGEIPSADPLTQTASDFLAMSNAAPESPNRYAIRQELLSIKPMTVHIRRRSVWVSVALAAALAFSGVAVASRKALPGEFLYPLKRALSAVDVATSFGGASHASALLDRAQGALEDARILARKHKRRSEIKALDVFEGDLSDARSEISKLSGSEQTQLSNRADDLERLASDLRSTISFVPQGRSTVTPDEERNGQSEGPFVQPSTEHASKPHHKKKSKEVHAKKDPHSSGHGKTGGAGDNNGGGNGG